MDNILDKYHISKLNEGQINNLNRPITPKEIEAVIKNLSLSPPPKSSGLIGLNVEFCQNFKKELIPILLQFFHTIKTKGTLPNTFIQGYSYPDTQATLNKIEN